MPSPNKSPTIFIPFIRYISITWIALSEDVLASSTSSIINYRRWDSLFFSKQTPLEIYLYSTRLNNQLSNDIIKKASDASFIQNVSCQVLKTF